jgi:hypothetical protein
MCEKCAGFGGWSVESTFNPFTGSIGYTDIVCTACGGKGEFDEDDEPIEEEDFGEAFGP